MSINSILKTIKDESIEFIDLQFGDMFGRLHHFTLPAKMFNEDVLAEGIPFDGSSIRAWRSIDKSDMLFRPDLNSSFVDVFTKRKTLCMFGNIHDPSSDQPYGRDVRSILSRAIEYMKSTGVGDTIYFGPEPEFFIFDSVRYTSEKHMAFYQLESNEAPWSSMDEDSLGHKIDHKEGYFPASPSDRLVDLRNDICHELDKMGVECEVHHHEVATAGQCEIGFRFADAVTSADNVHKLKYTVKNMALRHGKSATFMPKPIFEDNGSGMHTHLSIWKGGKNMFSGDNYGSLSQEALYAIGGILKHGRSIQAFTNPSANSYRRLIPGYEAPVKLAYSATNRSAAIRIPYTASDKGRRIEFRCPDSSGSPHLAFAAIMMAALDGIVNRIDPGEPMDKNIYDLPPEILSNLESTCASQEEALSELANDCDWLKKGDVFSDGMIEAYVNHRKETEVEPLKLRPNPHEFGLYYDV